MKNVKSQSLQEQNWMEEIQRPWRDTVRKKIFFADEKFYKIYVRPYGTDTWGLRENVVAILKRAERSMVRAMCGVKVCG